MMDLVGSTIRIKGKTLRGKNRINRGGEEWRVTRWSEEWGCFLESVAKGPVECFWASLPYDQHVRLREEEDG
jgi:hypothetical protein